MTAPTLSDLLTPRTRATIEAILMAALQEAPIEGMPGVSFPVTDWLPGSFERTMLKMIATGYVDREDVVAMVTAGGFLDLAAQITDADGNLIEGWMELLAAQNYNNPRGEATYTKQMLLLTCTAGPGPYTRAAGEIVAYAPATGNKYTNVASVTIPDGGSVTAVFQAESPGLGYNDSAGSILGLVTPMPGVSVSNPTTAHGLPASFLTGTGTIEVSSTTVTTIPRTVKLHFTTSGRIDDSSAKFTLTLYQGTAVTTSGPFTASGSFSEGDLTVALTDGADGTQSFNAGDDWIVGVPGTPLLQAGAEKEPLDLLAKGCRNQWRSLSDIPTAGRLDALVMACSKANGLGISKTKTSPSLDVAGLENIYIAGSTATATPEQVAIIQAYVSVRVDEIEWAVVIAAQAHSVALGGTVKCRRGKTAAVQAKADLAWAQYIASMPIGGSEPEGRVLLAELEQALMDAGAYNVSGLTLGGSADDIVLAAHECATLADDPDGTPSLALTWLEVS
jgi:hypothetical protein